METRAHHLLIGSFMLAFLVLIVAFALWLAKTEVDREVARYNIYFSGSVAGLGVGGDVRFNGIKVGSVSQILIYRVDTSRVRVIAEVAGDTPIKEDSEATLQLQGITGVSFVQISPGSREAAILPVVSGRDMSKYPTIRSRTSAIEALFEAAPDLATRAAGTHRLHWTGRGSVITANRRRRGRLAGGVPEQRAGIDHRRAVGRQHRTDRPDVGRCTQ